MIEQDRTESKRSDQKRDNRTRAGATTILFVIPARNEERHLASCLDSINAQQVDTENSDCSTVVVDNASTDRTCEIAREHGADVVKVQPGKAGRARNRGAEARSSDFIAFVDADCVLPPHWLANCMEHFRGGSVAAVGAVQAKAPADAPWVERTWLDAATRKSDTQWSQVDWLPAFNFLVRTEDFNAIGGFDESLETCEDSDLSYRLGQRGQLRRDYRCPVRHLGESKSVGEFFRREMWRSGGNFHSALKRGALLQESISLFIPVGYVMLLLITVLLVITAAFLGGMWWAVAGLFATLLVFAPVAIATYKSRRLSGGGVGLLIAIYLLARGLGPLFAARRVERR